MPWLECRSNQYCETPISRGITVDAKSPIESSSIIDENSEFPASDSQTGQNSVSPIRLAIYYKCYGAPTLASLQTTFHSVLIVICVQNDFCPGGPLADGDLVIDNCNPRRMQ